MVLYSECRLVVYFIELTIPLEDAIEEGFERNKLKYGRLASTHKTSGDRC